MLRANESVDRVERVSAVASAADVLSAQEAVRAVHVSDALRNYVVSLLVRTRADRRVELGASPRAGLLLLRASKARALLNGRDHALPDDVRALATAVLAHRIVLEPEAADTSPAVVIDDALMSTPAHDWDPERLSAMGSSWRGAGGTTALGATLVILAGVIDAQALYVPGLVLLLLGAGATLWVRGSARGVEVHRHLSARRVVEDEPLLVEVEIRAGRLAPPAGSFAIRCCGHPHR